MECNLFRSSIRSSHFIFSWHWWRYRCDWISKVLTISFCLNYKVIITTFGDSKYKNLRSTPVWTIFWSSLISLNLMRFLYWQISNYCEYWRVCCCCCIASLQIVPRQKKFQFSIAHISSTDIWVQCDRLNNGICLLYASNTYS